MGFIEDIDALDLSDDLKQKLRDSHQAEASQSAEEVAQLRARARRNDVDKEIAGLKDLGLAESPGVLKFVRRILLSDDGEDGAVLLTDSDMGLSDDDATGATQRESITVAGAIRQFIELLPKNKEGKLALSDQALLADDIVTDADKPRSGEEDPAAKSKAASERLGTVTGIGVQHRSRRRYAGGAPVPAGGDK